LCKLSVFSLHIGDKPHEVVVSPSVRSASAEELKHLSKIIDAETGQGKRDVMKKVWALEK
jgi:hypothetical protein